MNIKDLENKINETNRAIAKLNRESVEVRLNRIMEACRANGWSLTEIISK